MGEVFEESLRLQFSEADLDLCVVERWSQVDDLPGLSGLVGGFYKVWLLVTEELDIAS